ncbi:UNVERIFIED_CONTAM: hypothetical protein Slati_0979100 [Sesamum latifolium]|uniref:Reverse transcriptase zinc-binding domain-containing protein n=1 Tax=Sesamum latifolium TaxID=2727402 RepID=A0AAW2XR32_9LAMI
MAEMGSRPSLTWRGICRAKRLLEEGCRQDSEGDWRWRFERTGRFSVKSAYNHAVIMRDRSLASSSHSTLHLTHGRGSSWSMLWRVRVPPKVRLLMWQLCKEALPTLELLARRAAGVDMNCAICGLGVESIRHVFWECSFTRQVWALSNLARRSISSWIEGPGDWVSGKGDGREYSGAVGCMEECYGSFLSAGRWLSLDRGVGIGGCFSGERYRLADLLSLLSISLSSGLSREVVLLLDICVLDIDT